MRSKFRIWIAWDDVSGVWFVEKSDVPGLHAEAKTLDEMLEVFRGIVPELLVANVFSRSHGARERTEVRLELISRREEVVVIGRRSMGATTRTAEQSYTCRPAGFVAGGKAVRPPRLRCIHSGR